MSTVNEGNTKMRMTKEERINISSLHTRTREKKGKGEERNNGKMKGWESGE